MPKPADGPGARAASGRLRTHRVPARPAAVLLVLHGGREHSVRPSRPWHGAALRMRPFLSAVRRSPHGGSLALASVRYRVRGWNRDRSDPVHDAREALAELRARLPGLPVVLLGHSMGGRTALRLAGDPQVAGAVVLAPWTPAGEPVAHLSGAAVVIVHGSRDRVTDPEASLRFARRARAAGADVARLVVPGGDHAMLAHAAVWHRLAADAACAAAGAGPYPALVAAAFGGGGPGDGLDVPVPSGPVRPRRRKNGPAQG
ncbi:alpha/beta hydrolase [Streptomyces sp. NPDC059637]|uniref:alpha/beta hydrolase n=1 Tax=Streptomyces sp. NPDC059637 TaxID=3347752 RepID=UPI0036B320CF